jgi:uncharacterized protein (TIGR03790 family)
MNIKPFIVMLLTLPALTLTGQVSYEDVAVIINENDNNSVEIGQYFAQQRKIPVSNLIYIQCPSEELTDSIGFTDIRQQIEDKMSSQELTGKINYLVTTKGIPFNVRRSESCAGIDGVRYCSSLDSELTLLFSEWNDKILDDGFVQNPYFQKSEYFDRNEFGIYLVTRLDAYTVDDVKTMIDRSGPGVEVAKNSAQFIVDFSYVSDSNVSKLFTEFVQPTVNYLILNDWHVVFDPTEDMLTDQSDVLGYFSINYQPSNKVLNFSWLKGSISEILLSTGNLTFYKDQNVFNELSIPDLLKEGAASSSTYVNSTYFSLIIQLSTLYERYFSEEVQPAFNLAESYFMAMPRLSNQYLIIGDPKTSLAIQQSGVEEKNEVKSLIIYPNPADHLLNVSFMANIPGKYRLQFTDLTGRSIFSKEMACYKGLKEQKINVSNFPEGIYFINITGPGDNFRTMKFIKTGR